MILFVHLPILPQTVITNTHANQYSRLLLEKVDILIVSQVYARFIPICVRDCQPWEAMHG